MLSNDSRRMALLTAMAAALGFAGGGAAWVLLHLIAFITNAAVFGQWGWHPPSYSTLDPTPRLLIVAVVGALLISLLPKWSPVIRGRGPPPHPPPAKWPPGPRGPAPPGGRGGILTKQSRIAPRTAVAKPVSAAIA